MGRRKSASITHSLGIMFTLSPARTTPMLTVTFWMIRDAPAPSARSVVSAEALQKLAYVAGGRRVHLLDAHQVRDEACADPARTLRGMVCTPRAPPASLP